MLLRLHRRHRDEGGGWVQHRFPRLPRSIELDNWFRAGSLVGAAVSLLGAAVSWLRSVHVQKERQNAGIESMLNKAIELSMMYPHVERDDYCAAWPEPPGDGDQRERYDNYCCFLFNMLEGAWRLKGRPKLVAELVPVEEYAWRHRAWWSSDAYANANGYSPGFRSFIKKILDDIKRTR